MAMKQSATDFTDLPTVNGALPYAASNVFNADPTAKYTSVTAEGIGESNYQTIIYEVPVGRSALIVNITQYNPTAAALTVGIFMSVTSSQWATIAAISDVAANGTRVLAPSSNTPRYMSSGNKLALYAPTEGVVTRILILEWSDASPYKVVSVVPNVGNPILYECPAGKNAMVTTPHQGFTNERFAQPVTVYGHTGSATATISLQAVPDGQSFNNKWKIATKMITGSNPTFLTPDVPVVLTPGDALISSSNINNSPVLKACIYEWDV